MLIVGACANDDSTPNAPSKSTACVKDSGSALELGLTPTRIEEFEFIPIQPNEPIGLEFGSQGAWMISFGVRTTAQLATDSPGYVSAWVVGSDGELITELHQKAAIFPSTDGYYYVVQKFLVLAAIDPVMRIFDWDGKSVDLTVELKDGCGTEMGASVPIKLELGK